MHENKFGNGKSEIELLESELLEELQAVRDVLNGTRLCGYHTCEGRKSCEDASEEFENLADTFNRTFQRVKKLKITS